MPLIGESVKNQVVSFRRQSRIRSRVEGQFQILSKVPLFGAFVYVLFDKLDVLRSLFKKRELVLSSDVDECLQNWKLTSHFLVPVSPFGI